MLKQLTIDGGSDAVESDADLAVDEVELYTGRPRWEPQTEADFEYVLQNLAEAESSAERIKRNADASIAAQRRRAAFWREHYRPHLEEFARARLVGTRDRTVPLLNGKLAFVSVPARIAFDEDEGRLAEWVVANRPDERGQIVKETVSVNKTELKRRLAVSGDNVVDAETGEVVDIAWVEPKTERFDIRVK